MNGLGIALIVIGTLYLIYSIIFRNTITIYFKGSKIVEEKREEYFKIQLLYGFINSFIVIATGSAIVIYNINTPYLLIIPLLVHLVNFIMKTRGRAKGLMKL